MKTWRLLEDGEGPAAWNMAVDEAILALYPRLKQPTLRFYRWSRPTLSLGRFQPSDDVDLGACRRRGIEVVRRPTGGRAVLHDDELTYGVVAPLEGFPPGVEASYEAISLALAEGLRALNLPTSLQVRNRKGRGASAACFETPAYAELTIGGKKVIGSAQTRTRWALLQHGSVPLSLDVQALAEVLKRPHSALQAKAAGLNEFAPRPLDMGALKRALKGGFKRHLELRLETAELTPEEAALARRLAAEKYAHPDWTWAAWGAARKGLRLKGEKEGRAHHAAGR